ncbi:MAG: proton-conducting transporter membrane subunit, partial [Alistipes sp.]|nr:proton-conducting transporter membrane subunit [Alistipes sp.]
TNNYKRFLSYSTVENMGLVAIGLGIGGIGAWAAIFHVVCHTFIKSSLFLQIGVVAQIYNSCRINRLGEYLSVNRVGAIALLIGTVVLLAFPPSPLFISELMLFKSLFMDGSWWLAVVMLVLMCVVIYSVAGRVIRLCYQPSQNRADMSAVNKTLSWSALLLLIIAMVLGLWQPTILTDIITEIVTF